MASHTSSPSKTADTPKYTRKSISISQSALSVCLRATNTHTLLKLRAIKAGIIRRAENLVAHARGTERNVLIRQVGRAGIIQNVSRKSVLTTDRNHGVSVVLARIHRGSRQGTSLETHNQRHGRENLANGGKHCLSGLSFSGNRCIPYSLNIAYPEVNINLFISLYFSKGFWRPKSGTVEFLRVYADIGEILIKCRRIIQPVYSSTKILAKNAISKPALLMLAVSSTKNGTLGGIRSTPVFKLFSHQQRQASASILLSKQYGTVRLLGLIGVGSI